MNGHQREGALLERAGETLIASPDGTGQYVQAAVVLADACKKFSYLHRVRVIDLRRNSVASAMRDFVRGVLDCAGRFIDRFGSATGGPAGDVPDSARFTQRESDTTATTSAGTGDYGDFALKCGSHTAE